MSDALGRADTILFLARQLAEELEGGMETVADARELESTIREAEGWLITCRNYLDPESTIGRD